jgi:hypothetical protein
MKTEGSLSTFEGPQLEAVESSSQISSYFTNTLTPSLQVTQVRQLAVR